MVVTTMVGVLCLWCDLEEEVDGDGRCWMVEETMCKYRSSFQEEHAVATTWEGDPSVGRP